MKDFDHAVLAEAVAFVRLQHEHTEDRELLFTLLAGQHLILQRLDVMSKNSDFLNQVATDILGAVKSIAAGGAGGSGAADPDLAASITAVGAARDQLLAQVGGAASGAAVASLTVSPTTLSLSVGGSQGLTVKAQDANGNDLPGAPVTYTSSNTAVCTVDANGVVTAVGTGSTTVTVLGGPNNVAQASVSVSV